MNEFAGQLVRELFQTYQGAFYRCVDPASRALTKETFRLLYAAALMRLAAQLTREAAMSEEQFGADRRRYAEKHHRGVYETLCSPSRHNR